MTEHEKMMRDTHGDAVIYEDRGIIDMESVEVDCQPCGAVDWTLTPSCARTGVYRIFGSYRDKHKGARAKQFSRHLCEQHLAEWAALHGTTVEALLAKGGDE